MSWEIGTAREASHARDLEAEDDDDEGFDDDTALEKAVWNWVAKHPPEEKPLTAIVLLLTVR